MTKIKICGMVSPADISAANRLSPEYIGFVLAEKSPRRLTVGQALKLRERLRDEITPVGVFMNQSMDLIKTALLSGAADIAQLHGEEDDEFILRLKDITGKIIIKAFKIRGRDDAAAANKSAADMILLDSGAGTGQKFDWKYIKEIKRPYFLAGGLDPLNVAGAVEKFRPFAVDVSSGVEENGKKLEEKMKEFITAARSAAPRRNRNDKP